MFNDAAGKWQQCGLPMVILGAHPIMLVPWSTPCHSLTFGKYAA